jgi:hypothetical protein
LKSEIDKLQIERQQLNQLQEQVLNRIKEDIEMKTSNQEENLLNIKLQQSVEDLNVKLLFLLDFNKNFFFFFKVNHERLC